MTIRAVSNSSNDYSPMAESVEDEVNLMLARQARENREMARANRQSARQEADEASEQEIGSMQQAANLRLASGIANGMMQMAEAGTSFGQARAELRSGANQGQPGANADNQAQRNAANTAAITNWKATGEMLQGARSITTASIDRAASGADIEAKEHARAAERAREYANDARDAVQDADQQAQRALERVSQATQSRAQLASALSANIRA